jgi:hypothetical protein
MIFKAEPTEKKRYIQARAIIQMFVQDGSTMQVNLKGETKNTLVQLLWANKVGECVFFISMCF